jgi:SAM-dependent methyltransferase
LSIVPARIAAFNSVTFELARSRHLPPTAPRYRAEMTTDYDLHGHGYASKRRADAGIAARIEKALGDARTVVNVGAGTGSYEPEDRYVLAVEPSATMRAQRPAHLVPAIDARAEQLPLDDDSVDAAMAIATVHHWSDQQRGLRELRRVARGQVVILTFDMEEFDRYWLVAEYGPELAAAEHPRFLPIGTVVEILGEARVEPVVLASDCSDGMVEAYFARPEVYLDPSVRAAQSVWRRLPGGVEERIVNDLAADLASGAWDAKHPGLRSRQRHESALRLVVSE